MSFSKKVLENKRVAIRCNEIAAYNAGVTRAYYSVFQKAKGYLIEKGFNYDQYLLSIKMQDERRYSHGTIRRALIECLINNGKSITQIFNLNLWDDLYKKRLIADYDETMIDQVDLKNCLRSLEKILGIFD